MGNLGHCQRINNIFHTLNFQETFPWKNRYHKKQHTSQIRSFDIVFLYLCLLMHQCYLLQIYIYIYISCVCLFYFLSYSSLEWQSTRFLSSECKIDQVHFTDWMSFLPSNFRRRFAIIQKPQWKYLKPFTGIAE